MDTPPENERRDAAQQRRAKLFGRTILVVMALLALAYIIPLFLGRG